MGADRVNVDRSVPPGGVIDLSIKLTAPPSEGSYRGHFTMYTPTGIRFMTSSGSQDGIWVDIRVQGSGPAPSPTPADLFGLFVELVQLACYGTGACA